MTSNLIEVPSLRALAFNKLVKHYAKTERRGNCEAQLVDIVSSLPPSLLPEFMRRKAAVEAVRAAKDSKEIVRLFKDTVLAQPVDLHVTSDCEICDHSQVVHLTTLVDTEEEMDLLNAEIDRVAANKRRKMLHDQVIRPVCSHYGFAESEPEED